MTKKQEPIEEHKEQDAKDVEISQLNARVTQLEQENLGLRNLIIQIKDIFDKESNLMTVAAHDLESGDKVLAGMKLRELSEVIENNKFALASIVTGWRKE